MHDEKSRFYDVGITKTSSVEDKIMAIAESRGKRVLLKDICSPQGEYLMAMVKSNTNKFGTYVAEPVDFSSDSHVLEYENLVQLIREK